MFIASLSVGMVFSGSSYKKENTSPSLILEIGGRFLYPFVFLFGVYVFVHGHITPGGGFPAGAVLASAFLLSFITQREYKFNKISAQKTETLMAIIFIMIATGGLYFKGFFLSNFIPFGKLMDLLSGGIIPVLYVLIGIKVGAELGGVIYLFLER